jgi:hypothetical protein
VTVPPMCARAGNMHGSGTAALGTEGAHVQQAGAHCSIQHDHTGKINPALVLTLRPHAIRQWSQRKEGLKKEMLLFTIAKNDATMELKQANNYLWQSIIVVMSDMIPWRCSSTQRDRTHLPRPSSVGTVRFCMGTSVVVIQVGKEQFDREFNNIREGDSVTRGPKA